MAATLDLALLSGASYNDTRSPINRFPVSQGWTLYSVVPEDDQTGFEARAFQTTTEIVISYAGTYGDGGPLSTNVDKQCDRDLGLGRWHEQLGQAAAYYLQIKAAKTVLRTVLRVKSRNTTHLDQV